MSDRHVYLKIEVVAGYNPVNPEPKPAPPKSYRRDCMRGMGHEDGTIPPTEVAARALNALIYREYLDAGYTIPKPDKIVPADINEPVYYARVPGTVIYAHPGDRLHIHVLNADSSPHSFHVHGVSYGIDSDGAWPLGTQSTDGRRSDEICSGQSWTYTYDVTDEMIGAWPFHDHYKQIGDNINRGLFGGLIVRPHTHPHPPAMPLPTQIETFLAEDNQSQHRQREPTSHEVEALRQFLKEWAAFPQHHHEYHELPVVDVPLFFHFMSGLSGTPAFDSGPLPPASPPFTVTFGATGSYGFHCNIHSFMHGTVIVSAIGVTTATFNIVDGPPMRFVNPVDGTDTVTVQPGGTVQWIQASSTTHTVTDDGGGIPSYCFNGRCFLGNTPTVEARAGQKIRWYVFNLDLSTTWHNFHPHSQRWNFAGETVDVRSLSPAESFYLETTAPPVLLLPPDIQTAQDPEHRPATAKEYKIRGDFLVHCHVEMHMMQGLTCVVRSRQSLWLTDAQAAQLAATTGLPLDDGKNDCPAIDLDRCQKLGAGKIDEVPGDPRVTMMHAALVPNSDAVLYWGYFQTPPAGQSRLWSPTAGYTDPANQPFQVAPPPPPPEMSSNLHSAAHAYLDTAEGTLLAHGGETEGNSQSFLFHPATRRWELAPPTQDPRFYATTLTLADGKLLTLFGFLNAVGTGPFSIEVYDPAAGPTGAWEPKIPLPDPPLDFLFYPWTYLLPGGDLFIAGHEQNTSRISWTPAVAIKGTWPTSGDRSPEPAGGEHGTSVLLPLRPPSYAPRVLIAGGATATTQQTAEWIDLSAATPAWTLVPNRNPNLNQPRPEMVNSVLLPDGKVVLSGGVAGSGGGATGPIEVFDPDHPTDAWVLGPTPKHPRGYHSSAILLVDGSVLMGGDPRVGGVITPHERYYPSYYFKPRPIINSAPAAATHGATLTINTPDASSIDHVVLLRPGAVTHGFNMSQRFIACDISGRGATSIQFQTPPNDNIGRNAAPPGWYLLFIVDGGRVPSVGNWIRLTP